MPLADSTILFAICGDTLTEYLHFWAKELWSWKKKKKETEVVKRSQLIIPENMFLSYASIHERYSIFLAQPVFKEHILSAFYSLFIDIS